MKRRQYTLLVALTIISGLVGGAVSNRVFMARPAVAQDKQDHEKVITAEEFRLVNENGEEVGVLGAKTVGPYLKLLDKSGKIRFIIGLVQGDPILGMSSSEERDITIPTPSGPVTIKAPITSFKLAMDPLGEIHFILEGNKGKAEVRTFPSPYIELSGNDGKVMWQAP